MKRFFRFAFLSWLLGGFLFGALFFLFIGFTNGFTRESAFVCAAAGFAWGIACFLVTSLIAFFHKFLFSEAAMIAALEKEEQRGFSYRKKYFGTTIWPIGKKRTRYASGLAMLWLGEDRLWFGVASNRFHIRVSEYPFEQIDCVQRDVLIAYVRIQPTTNQEGFLFCPYSDSDHDMSFDELLTTFAEIGLYREPSHYVTGKLFLPFSEADPENSARFFFAGPEKEKTPFEADADDLFVHIDDHPLFWKSYSEILFSKGNHEEQIPGFVFSYHWEETRSLIEEIRGKQPTDFELLLPWLKKALDHNGFYVELTSPASYRERTDKENA